MWANGKLSKKKGEEQGYKRTKASAAWPQQGRQV